MSWRITRVGLFRVQAATDTCCLLENGARLARVSSLGQFRRPGTTRWSTRACYLRFPGDLRIPAGRGLALALWLRHITRTRPVELGMSDLPPSIYGRRLLTLTVIAAALRIRLRSRAGATQRTAS